MRDSLINFPSFMLAKRPTKQRIHADDEMNVFASDMVSAAYILDALRDVRQNRAIVKLEVEDMLIANEHHSFLPMVRGVFASGDRPWKYLKFVDTIDVSDMLWWQGMKHVLMGEYEKTIDSRTNYAGIVSFQAKVQINEGANKDNIRTLVNIIEGDQDLQQVGFSGALFGYSHDTLPDALANLFDDDGRLQESFVITVNSGWTSSSHHEASHCVLMACKEVLHDDYCKSHTEVRKERGHGKGSSGNEDVLSLISAPEKRRTPGRTKSNPTIIKRPPAQHSLTPTRRTPLKSNSLYVQRSIKPTESSNEAPSDKTEVEGSRPARIRSKSMLEEGPLVQRTRSLTALPNLTGKEDSVPGPRRARIRSKSMLEEPPLVQRTRSLTMSSLPNLTGKEDSSRSPRRARIRSKSMLEEGPLVQRSGSLTSLTKMAGNEDSARSPRRARIRSKSMLEEGPPVKRSITPVPKLKGDEDSVRGPRRARVRSKSTLEERPLVQRSISLTALPNLTGSKDSVSVQNYRWEINRSSNRTDSPVPPKPVRDGPSRTTSSRSLLASESKRSSKSQEKGCKNPDYDWTQGNFADTTAPCAV
jgi:hypothetical protein